MSASAGRAGLERLLAKEALHELITGFSRAADRLDEAAMVELFHPDAIVDSGVVRGDPKRFAAEFVRWVRRHAKRVFHAVTNEWFAVNGEHAVGESYVIAISRLRGEIGELEVLTAGRYLDRFERRDGVWKISERRFILDHSLSRPAPPETADASGSKAARGAYAPYDPIFAFWPDSSSGSGR